MTPERWNNIADLFQSTLGQEPKERTAFLVKACADDLPLLSEVLSLIRAHEKASRFIETPAAETMEQLPIVAQPSSIIGEYIDNYKIIGEIGSGGMGAVYLAVRDNDQEQVAIKLVKQNLATDFILQRFSNEQQILASLDHPNIAKLLDYGSTEDGLPYLVMEYIKGKPIDEYCDSNKLPTTERLKLFQAVCSAINYIHQNHIIHRDIKPSNIFVTAEGVPKLLDFGIAKLLNPLPSSLPLNQTATMMRLMTPEYASPEQARGEKISVATDVYSLGVMLYELLSGHRPYWFDSRHPKEIERTICEKEPDNPSKAISRIEETIGHNGIIRLTPESVSKTRDGKPGRLKRRLAGDLDNIVLMAMRKEPVRRYSSVEQLSEDIHKHLNGLPVIAEKDTHRCYAMQAGERI